MVGLEKLNVINFNIVLKHNHSRINEMDKKIIANNIRSIAIDIIAADDSYKSERQKIQDGIKIVADRDSAEAEGRNRFYN